jgi:hypothetical protein
MTREEARKLLEGTWSFTASGNSVLVRETSLLQDIALLSKGSRPAVPGRNRNPRVAQAAPLYLAAG